MKFIRLIAGFFLGVSLLTITACKTEQPVSAPEHTYKIRALIISLPEPSQRPKEITLRHEPIPNFVGFDGSSETMNSMTMSFPVSDAIDLQSYHVGDEVEGDYEIRWKGQPKEMISNLIKLPSGSVHLPANGM